MATRTKKTITGKNQPEAADDVEFLLTFEDVIFEKTFAFLFAETFLFLFAEFVENGIRLFAIGATELSVVVAAEFAKLETELRALVAAAGTVSVAKSETELRALTAALGTVSVAKSETELRASGTVLVAKTDNEFSAEFFELFFFIRLDTVFILELSKYS